MWLIVAVLAALAVSATLAAGSGARRALALATGVATLAIPFAIEGDLPVVRFVAALGASWGLARIIDLVRERPARPLRFRLWHAVAGFDTREVRFVAPRFDAALVGTGLVYAALGGAGLLLAQRAPVDGAGHYLGRWLGGAMFAYCNADAVDKLGRAGYGVSGVHVEPLQRFPVGSRSVAEFWGARWNRAVGSWLRLNLFTPLARRRRARMGLLVAFLASAVLHAYLAGVPAGPWMAASMGGFFLVQAGLLAVERQLGVARFPETAARVWMVSVMLASSPLFVEPMLRVVLPDSR